MKKWSFLVAAAIATALLAAGCAAKAQEVPERPNLVFVLADDSRYEGLMLQENVSELAGEGTLFRDFHITDPQCCPSRATFLTGEYPHNTGILKNNSGGADGAWDEFKAKGHTEDYLPVLLQHGGYKTFLGGKLINGCEPGCQPPGFDQVFLTPNDPTRDLAVGQKAEEFFRTNAPNGPVAIFLWVRSPHCPCSDPPQFDGDFDHLTRQLPASYAEQDVSEKLGVFSRLKRPGPDGMRQSWLQHLEMTKRVDYGLGLLRDTATDIGEYEKTVFAVSGDNGWNLGEHRVKRGKTLPYTASQHEPLVLSGPGVPTAIRDDLTGNHDFVPTILPLLRLPEREGVDGRDLFAAAPRESILVEHPQPYIYVGKDRTQLPGYKAMLTDEGDLYIEWKNGHKEYYDEPTHTEPSPPPPGISERLRGLVTCSGPACQTAEN
jgi:N-acetylglucosamine-6-sulfatase